MLTHWEQFAGMIKSARPTRESAPRRIAYLASSRRSIRRAQNMEQYLGHSQVWTLDTKTNSTVVSLVVALSKEWVVDGFQDGYIANGNPSASGARV